MRSRHSGVCEDEPGISRFPDVQLHIRGSTLRVAPERRHSLNGSRMTSTDIEKIFRDEASRALATLIRLVGDFDLAQDALQDAFAVALERWPSSDPPSNPRAWLVNVGRNKAIDRIRRQITIRDKQSELTHEWLNNAAASDQAFESDVL